MTTPKDEGLTLDPGDDPANPANEVNVDPEAPIPPELPDAEVPEVDAGDRDDAGAERARPDGGPAPVEQ